MNVAAFASFDQAGEGIDAAPFAVRRFAIEIEIVPRSPLANEASTFDCEHGFAKHVGLVIATAVHALARVFGNVLRGTFTRFAEADVNDVRIAGQFIPGV